MNSLASLKASFPYSTSDNETSPISRVLIGLHLIFHSLTSPPCCNSPRKCTPVKYKKRQKARFPIVTQTPSFCFHIPGFLFPFGCCKALLSMPVTETSSHFCESSSEPQSCLFLGQQDETTTVIQQLLKLVWNVCDLRWGI